MRSSHRVASVWPRVAALVGCLVLPALAAGCGEPPAVRPDINLVAPENGAQLPSSTVQIEVQVERFTLTDQYLDPTEEGEPFLGHWHLFVDYDFVGDFAGTSAVIDLEPGTHSIAVELVNQNHVPILGTPYSEVIVEVPPPPAFDPATVH